MLPPRDVHGPVAVKEMSSHNVDSPESNGQGWGWRAEESAGQRLEPRYGHHAYEGWV